MTEQLTLDGVEEMARDLRVEAQHRHGVPSDIACAAERACVSAFRSQRVTARLHRHARAYFWAVVRRSVSRTRSAPEVTARFVLSTVARDLEGAGRSSQAIWEEIARGWADKVPQGVLEEYRARLCA